MSRHSLRHSGRPVRLPGAPARAARPLSPPSLHIRPYRASDLEAVLALFQDTVRRVNRRDYGPEQIAAWAPDSLDRDRWAARLAASRTLVAELGPTLVGFSNLETDGHLDLLYVSADHQGLGIGTALVGALAEQARAWGLDRLVTEASITARAFFEARGFHLVATQEVARRDATFRNYRMVREL